MPGFYGVGCATRGGGKDSMVLGENCEKMGSGVQKVLGFRRTTGATPARQSSETAWPNVLEQAGTSSFAPAILDSSKN